jgi:hypothetical protein
MEEPGRYRRILEVRRSKSNILEQGQALSKAEVSVKVYSVFEACIRKDPRVTLRQ